MSVTSTAVQISLLMLLYISVDTLGDLADKQIDHQAGVGVHLYSNKSVWNCQKFREPDCERYFSIFLWAL